MKKSYILWWFFWAIFIFLIWILFSQNHNTENVLKDSFIKNIWFDTNLEKDVPYVIWNQLEFYYILDKKIWSIAQLNIEKLKEKIDISEIQVWDTIFPWNQNISVDLDNTTPIKISWKSKVNNNINDTNIQDLVEIELIESIEDIPEKIEEKQIEDIKLQPNNIIFQNTNFSWNIDNILEFTWENIHNIEFLNIGWLSFSPYFNESMGYILIPQSSFASGKYFIFLQLKNGEIIALDQQISFQTSQEEINIVNITPDTVQNDKSSYIVVQWNGFQKVISVQLNNNIVLQKTSFQVINDKVMSIKVPEWLDSWKYNFNFMTPDKIVEIPYIWFTVSQ